MTDPRKRPRICKPVAEWPEQDRLAWQSARKQTTDILAIEGAAAHLSHKTVRVMESAYGRWLFFLSSRDDLDPNCLPGARVTEARLRAYLGELSSNASNTVRNRVRDLDTMIRYMDPQHDRTFLQRILQKLKSRAEPIRDKLAKMVPPEDLIALAATLMEKAETDTVLRSDWRASTYRDGLIILFLLFRPLRRSNLEELILGETFIEEAGRFKIDFPRSQMKNDLSYEATIPEIVAEPMRLYLEKYRPILLKGGEDKHLWISTTATPLDQTSIYGNVRRITRTHLGIALTPHLFRDIAVTSLGEENPELVRLGQILLHHTDSRVTEKHYNHARQHHAVNRYQAVIEEQRRNAAE